MGRTPQRPRGGDRLGKAEDVRGVTRLEEVLQGSFHQAVGEGSDRETRSRCLTVPSPVQHPQPALQVRDEVLDLL